MTPTQREYHRAQILRGLAQARRDGVRLGRPPKPFDQVRARELLASGVSRTATARVVGVDKNTIRRMTETDQRAT